ncbi:pentapeptide repeat-containing protein [Nonomuraea insulae]|uniref:Pentapeptide repeat-containing protein n=1 Tax=Nonomuraea insulae TaxID=1616787 RepID=A0ABW1D8Y5_9ACTN
MAGAGRIARPGRRSHRAAVWGVSAWLLQDLDKLPTLAEQVSARIEAARTALAAAAGVGAAVTLLLAVRRQRHQELAAAHTTHDAAERRVTELYTKAAEQLGNAQAPVRLVGLYALERLAQDTPALRQTIVDVLCAYLRMPYVLPAEQDRHEKIRAAQRAAQRAARTPGTARPGATGGRDPHEERQVRLTAQRILTAHLRYQPPPGPRRWWRGRLPDPNPGYWENLRLDLTGATLIDFNLTRCRLRTAGFGGATFTGSARFREATFTSTARFDSATFTREAEFGEATFTGDAEFGGATFTSVSRFDAATFTGGARFDAATFSGAAGFGGATFTGYAGFDAATFTSTAAFGKATFSSTAWFGKATFTGNAGFGGATFTRVVGVRRGDLHQHHLVQQGDLHQRRRVRRGDLHRRRQLRRGDGAGGRQVGGGATGPCSGGCGAGVAGRLEGGGHRGRVADAAPGRRGGCIAPRSWPRRRRRRMNSWASAMPAPPGDEPPF